MREVSQIVNVSRHKNGLVHARDLTEFDIIDSGCIVTRVTPVGDRVHVTIREQTESGEAVIDIRVWDADDLISIIFRY